MKLLSIVLMMSFIFPTFAGNFDEPFYPSYKEFLKKKYNGNEDFGYLTEYKKHINECYILADDIERVALSKSYEYVETNFPLIAKKILICSQFLEENTDNREKIARLTLEIQYQNKLLKEEKEELRNFDNLL
jgi:hypothetical protein